MKGSKVMSIWNWLFLVNNFPKMVVINNGFNDCFRVLICCVVYYCFFPKIISYSVRKMKLNMFEVIFAICFTVQYVSESLLMLNERFIMAHIAIILSENNLSDIIIEEIVCRNTCFVCNYNIWITFYIFLWNYESIKVGVQLVFNTIWEWHRFTAVIWENDTKSFIFPKLKVISAQNFEGNTTVLCMFCWTWCFFCRHNS
jgi:hypothetical protein